MPRLTITLSDERYQALKEAATKSRKSLVTVIDESLDFYGIKTGRSAAELVAQARKRATLSEDEALELAIQEVNSYRKQV
jgi:predicted CopG family antitoxin